MMLAAPCQQKQTRKDLSRAPIEMPGKWAAKGRPNLKAGGKKGRGDLKGTVRAGELAQSSFSSQHHTAHNHLQFPASSVYWHLYSCAHSYIYTHLHLF